MARTLAERGLQLAQSNGTPKWVRRFEHLLRVATGTPISGAPYEPLPCSFCLRAAGLRLTAGKQALICDDCVEACVNGRGSGTVKEGGIAAEVVCGFCGLSVLAVAKFGANGFFICSGCARWYWEEAIKPEG